jgi:hypothetical protein
MTNDEWWKVEGKQVRGRGSGQRVVLRALAGSQLITAKSIDFAGRVRRPQQETSSGGAPGITPNPGGFAFLRAWVGAEGLKAEGGRRKADQRG